MLEIPASERLLMEFGKPVGAQATTDWRPLMDEASARMLTSLDRPGGAVAQLGARLDGIEEVVGSNPIGSTKYHTCPEFALIH